MSNNVGNLNGKWQLLFKISVAIIPVLGFVLTFLTPWFIWATGILIRADIHMKESEKIVKLIESIDREHEEDINNIKDIIRELPPLAWQDRIIKIEDALLANSEDHTAIKINLEKIKAKLGVE